MTRYVLLKQEKLGPENLEQEDDQPDLDEFEVLLGNSMDSERTRDRWIDAVERIMEEQAFEQGKIHSRRNFTDVLRNGDYGMRDRKSIQ